jgi:small subunit ribosomal protein S4
MFLSLLERRLDNVIYRIGFAPTRNNARQLVSHRHVLVNGKRLNIPSYQVKIGDMVSLSGKAVEVPHIKKMLMNSKFNPPSWLERKAAAGKIVRFPKKDDIIEPISETDIVEFYSR